MDIEKCIKQVEINGRLKLTEEELKYFIPQIKEILDYFEIIKQAKTDDVKPSFHPIEINDIFRDDITEECLSQEEALSNAKHKKDGFFKGPKVV